jgi:peptidoglycan/LPS O-acetylase OafA/YrhL
MSALPRLAALDGLRGVAILLVVLFHAYHRWPVLMPWAMEYQHFPIIQFGDLGVHLFFLISGFVIFQTLDRCHGFGQFLYRRWLRLFPAMLMATVLIFATADLLPERPAGTPNIYSILPGLLFIDPDVMNATIGYRPIELEGAFWSLFVEVKFYLIFGGMYFICRRFNKTTYAVALLAGLFLLQVLAEHNLFIQLNIFLTLLSAQWFGWFAGGAYAYLAHKHNNRRYLACSALLIALAIWHTLHDNTDSMVGGALVYALFMCGLFWRPLGYILSNRMLLFFGFISYPLYLIHENAMVALAIKLHNASPQTTGLIWPLVALLLPLGLAYLIARFAEPILRRALQRGR